MEHTKGPWTIARAGRGKKIFILDLEQHEGNAALIASAPQLSTEIDRLKSLNAELVKACKAARNDIILLAENGTDRIKFLGGECNTAAETFAPLITNLDAVIKKAEATC